MIQLNALATISSENRIFPTPVTELCKRVLFRQSECKVCVDMCPTNAISLPFGPELSDACINCGLCQVVCPTETFEVLQSADQLLLESLSDQSSKVISDHKLFVHCHQSEAGDANSLSVNCLGNMTENALIAMQGADVQTLMVSSGKCSDCQMRQGMDLFKQSAATYKKISKLFSQSPVSIQLREKQKISRTTSTQSRRDFLRSLGTGVVKQAAKIVVNKEQKIRALLQAEEEPLKKRPSPRREMLRSLLSESLIPGKEISEADISAGLNLPWKKMLVDEANCVGCGVCVNVCPTGALVKEVDNSALTRTINHSLCTNCNVCAEACPQEVIRFEKPYNVGDIVTDSEVVVAKVALNSCFICGEIIPVSEGEVCTTCQKRQVVPMFM